MSQETASVLGNSYRHFLLGRIPRVKINFCLFRRFRRNCPGQVLGVMEGRRERQASIHPTEAHSFVASKYRKWRKGSRPRKGSRSVAWLDGMVEILVSARKALEPTSYPRLQDFLDALQSFEAYLRVAWLDGLVEILVSV